MYSDTESIPFQLLTDTINIPPHLYSELNTYITSLLPSDTIHIPPHQYYELLIFLLAFISTIFRKTYVWNWRDLDSLNLFVHFTTVF
jgi:hypothetical protein